MVELSERSGLQSSTTPCSPPCIHERGALLELKRSSTSVRIFHQRWRSMRKMCTFHLHVLLTSLRSLPLSLPSFLSSPPGQHTWALGQMALEDQSDLDRVANASVGSVLLHCLVCSCALSSLLLCSVEFALVLCRVCSCALSSLLPASMGA